MIFAANLVLKACSKVEVYCLRFHKRRSFWRASRLVSRWMWWRHFFKLLFNFVYVRQACTRNNMWLIMAFLCWQCFLTWTHHLIKLQGKDWLSLNSNKLVRELSIWSWLGLHELSDVFVFFGNYCILCCCSPTTTFLKFSSLLLSPREWKHTATSSILWCYIIIRWDQRLHLLFLFLYKRWPITHIC